MKLDLTVVLIKKTTNFTKVYRSAYGKRTDYNQDFVGLTGNKCYIPTSGCFFL